MIKVNVDVGKEFHFRLANRNELQGDGAYNAVDFRNKFLHVLDSKKAWENLDKEVILDFSNVKRIGPSFANEAFAYFMQYTSPENFLKKVEFLNIDKDVDLTIISKELKAGYCKK